MKNLFNRTILWSFLLLLFWQGQILKAENNYNELILPPCIIGFASQIGCDGMGTLDVNDDMITYLIDASNIDMETNSTQFSVRDTDNGTLYGVFQYDQGGEITIPYVPGTSLTLIDADDPSCTEEITPSMIPCSPTCQTEFVLVNDAISLGNDCYRLTDALDDQSGGMWAVTPLDLNLNFSLDFNINLGSNNGGADGLMFILQTEGTGAGIGGSGGNLGFSGLTPSVGIEFDDFRNFEGNLDANDPAADHMSFQKNGSLVHDMNGYLDPSVPFFELPNLEDGNDHHVIIVWDANNFQLTATIDGQSLSVNQDIVNTIFNGVHDVYWGWSGSTGSAHNIQTVCVINVIPDALTTTAQVTHIFCEEDGSIDLDVAGGYAPYTYEWSNGATTEDLTGITNPGIYSVLITEACGNTLLENYTVGFEECPPMCVITGSATQTGCDDQGTATPDDDLITYFVSATVTDGGNTGTFEVVHNLNIFEPFPYSGGSITIPYSATSSLFFRDFEDNNCTDILPITPVDCSVPCVSPVGTFNLVGSATSTNPTCYQLTTTAPQYQSGAIWYQNALDLTNDFTLNFTINLGSNDGFGADGMMFILQTQGTGVGGNGGNLGFGGLNPSVGVEFDTWMNQEQNLNIQDPVADHMSFQRNGSLVHDPTGYLDPLVPFTTLNNIEDGMGHNVIITWVAATNQLTASIDGITSTITQNIVNTIFGGNPNVFWGWSASTGAAINNQSVCVNNIQVTDAIIITDVISPVPCGGLGAIDLTVTGGVPPYTYSWSDAANTTSQDLIGIATGGIYTVTITDACNNTLVQSFTVPEIECPCNIMGFVENIGCDGMGTPDTSDDLITLFVNATNGSSSGEFSVVDLNTLTIHGPFQYSIGGEIQVSFNSILSLNFIDSEDTSCSDLVQIDAAPCSPVCTEINISILLDNYPKETSWELKDGTGTVIESSNGPLGQNDAGLTLEWDFCLVDDCYEFIIYDSYGDGICCDPFYGYGSYTLTDMSNGTILGSGGEFGFSETTSFCIENSISCANVVYDESDFEQNWGIWNDGGVDVARVNSSNIGSVGNYSIRLRDNTGVASSMTTNTLDLSSYQDLEIEFMYRARSMEVGEDFFLEMSLDGGSTFIVLEDWARGVEFSNNVNMTDVVSIPGPYTSNTQFRFRCDASGNYDFIYIDKVSIAGCTTDDVAVWTPSPQVLTPILSENPKDVKQEESAKRELAIIGTIFPNPTSSQATLKYHSKENDEVYINVYDMRGQLILSYNEQGRDGENLFQFDLSNVAQGTYVVEVISGNQREREKLVIIK